jgi:hypothetical protein
MRADSEPRELQFESLRRPRRSLRSRMATPGRLSGMPLRTSCVLALLMAVGSGFPRVVLPAPIPLGPEFRVNSYTTHPQGGSRVGVDSQGNFVVVWESGYGAYGPGLDGSQKGISAQRFDSAGRPLGSEFLVNSYTTADQSGPAVALAPDGRFVVSWSGCCSEGNFRTFAQRFDGLGNRLGTQFPVESANLGGGAAVATGADGRFFVAWDSFIESQNASDVFGRVFDGQGAPVTADFLVNSYTTSGQNSPQVFAAQDRSFLVAWSEAPQRVLQFSAQRFTPAGAKSGGPFILRRNPTGQNDFGPGVFTLDADGNFVGA